ncbi:hypothetical protein Bca52824_028537 [Brassica carinata]|uniref:Uncharacterized protein n=1 Tax=Brassica carinata TaxID=52824 RepID=A0A8X7VCG7_BRACI|nr:hypothetical protein Bca52824_028537 [Brassica carinata]
MSFAGGKDGSSKGFVKRVTSTFSIKKNKKNTTTTTTTDPKPLLPRSKSTGSNYEPMRHLPQGKKTLPDVKKVANTKRTKSAGVSPQPRREKIDDSSGKQFVKLRCFDDSDSVWLASDCASTTSVLEERRVSVSFHFSLDERVVSWLSNAAKSSLSLKENHHHHHHHHHQKKCSSENKRKDGDLSNKNCPRKSCEESSSHEEKRVSFSLEPEESPSPVKESGDSKRKKNVVEPLFWPLEQKFDWTPEDILKHFTMSPRRKKSIGTKAASTSPRSTRAQLQTRKLDLKEGCKRKLMFNGGPGGSNSKPTRIPELKRTVSSNKETEISKNQPIRNIVKRNKSLPSRLRKSSKISSKVVPVEESAGEIGSREAKTTLKKLIMTRKSRTFLEDDFALMNDFSIEKAVGLCEFRGREGIDSYFNTDGFLFEDSL